MLIVAAEASADVHAAEVVRRLRAAHPDLEAFGLAGPHLRAEGVEAVARAEDLSVMGLTEVLGAIPRALGILKRLARAAADRRPQVALLVDSPDLNLRLARRLKALGIPVVYFIGPTVWAWRRGRIRQVARWVDRMLVILPFEAELYAAAGVAARYVGHPLLDQGPPRPAAGEPGLAARRRDLGLDPVATTLALLPGSRRMELERCLPAMLDAARRVAAHRPDLQVALPVAPTLDRAALEARLAATPGLPPVHLVDGRAREVLEAADAAVVTSGTATLEAALAVRPMVVVYRMSWVTWALARLLVRTAHVALVNLLAGRRLVPELIQWGMRPKAIAAHLEALLPGGVARQATLAGLAEVRARMGTAGAAGRVAEEAGALLPPPPTVARPGVADAPSREAPHG